jgi:hypothetical protein
MSSRGENAGLPIHFSLSAFELAASGSFPVLAHDGRRAPTQANRPQEVAIHWIVLQLLVCEYVIFSQKTDVTGCDPAIGAQTPFIITSTDEHLGSRPQARRSDPIADVPVRREQKAASRISDFNEFIQNARPKLCTKAHTGWLGQARAPPLRVTCRTPPNPGRPQQKSLGETPGLTHRPAGQMEMTKV